MPFLRCSFARTQAGPYCKSSNKRFNQGILVLRNTEIPYKFRWSGMLLDGGRIALVDGWVDQQQFIPWNHWSGPTILGRKFESNIVILIQLLLLLRLPLVFCSFDEEILYKPRKYNGGEEAFIYRFPCNLVVRCCWYSYLCPTDSSFLHEGVC